MSDAYIHGFSSEEQARLVRQASVLAPNVFDGWDLSGTETLLEIGCAVGAELKLILERWPGIRVTGLDQSIPHLQAAGRYLAEEIAADQVELIRGDAFCMPLADDAFDCTCTIWMLEHVGDPDAVIREAMRVTKPDGLVILTEVDNATFGFEPASGVIAGWWDRFNRFQAAAGGDPFIGPTLEQRVRDLGGREVAAVEFPNVSSRHEPERKAILLEYLEELLLSGAESLMKSGDATERDLIDLREEFARLRGGGDVEFQYLAWRVTFRPGKM